MLDGRPLFLVGFMGSGKSTVGRTLARHMGWAFEDTDSRIEQDEGRSVAEIFVRSGELGFRRLESRVLTELGAPRRTVIATGGGIFAVAKHRREMQHNGCTLWLDARLSAIRQRVGSSADRPLWDTANPQSQRVLFEKRRAVYALALLRVDASGSPPAAVARSILAALGSLSG